MKKLIAILLLAASLSANAQRTMTLQECRTAALENAEDLLVANHKQQMSEYDLKNAKTAILPTVDASGNLLFMFPNIDMSGSELILKGVYTAGFTVAQPLYVGGKIATGMKMAQAAKDISDIQYDQARMTLLADVDNAYYSCIAVNQKVKMLETYLRQMEHLEKVVKSTIEADMATEQDLLRITSKKSEIEYNLQKAKNGYQLCNMALANYIGTAPDEQITPADTVITVDVPADLSEDLSQRPEVKLLEKQIEIKEQQIKMERAEGLPVVALSLGYTYCGNIKMEGTAEGPDGNYYPYSQKYDQGMTMLMLTAQVPLWHWGKNARNVKKAKLELEDSRLQLQKNSKLMSIEARQAVQNVTSGYSMCLTAQNGFLESEKNLQNMTVKYENQFCTLTDLLDAQSSWQQAVANLIEAQTQYKIYQTEYLRVTGKL
ncbi:MAG: TolC family protein [Bacteroidales bacterium]|nr:TolC family protein [Bacteroidales bacterium]